MHTKDSEIYYCETDSPIGVLTLTATEKGLCSIEFGSFAEEEIHLQKWAGRWLGEVRWIPDCAKFKEAKAQLTAYFAGRRQRFELQFDLFGTEFQKKVWQALQEIPYGATWSYKDVAAAVDSPKAVRAVGGANNRNPLPIVVPCHRVIGADGQMVGYGGGLDIKKFLLTLEKRQQHEIHTH